MVAPKLSKELVFDNGRVSMTPLSKATNRRADHSKRIN